MITPQGMQVNPITANPFAKEGNPSMTMSQVSIKQQDGDKDLIVKEVSTGKYLNRENQKGYLASNDQSRYIFKQVTARPDPTSNEDSSSGVRKVNTSILNYCNFSCENYQNLLVDDVFSTMRNSWIKNISFFGF